MPRQSVHQAMYPASETEFLPLAGSDHVPVIIDIEEEFQSKRGQFRYDKRYSSDTDFIDSISRGWNIGTIDEFGGIQNKLRICRRELARWKKRHKANSTELIQTLKFQLDAAERNPSTSLREVQNLRIYLNQAYRNEEKFWKAKSRNKWLKVGDRNTKYFHAATKIRKSRNRIKTIVDDQGMEHFCNSAIGKVAESYFQNLFTSTQYTDLKISYLRWSVRFQMR